MTLVSKHQSPNGQPSASVGDENFLSMLDIAGSHSLIIRVGNGRGDTIVKPFNSAVNYIRKLSVGDCIPFFRARGIIDESRIVWAGCSYGIQTGGEIH
jgi:galactose mutarotase-like enzyme